MSASETSTKHVLIKQQRVRVKRHRRDHSAQHHSGSGPRRRNTRVSLPSRPSDGLKVLQIPSSVRQLMSAVPAVRMAPLSASSASPLDDDLSGLTLHTSPPPSLAARFAVMPLTAGSSEPTPEEKRRSLEVGPRDPRGALHRFIEHLLSSEHSDSDPHLIAIGYELEALLSIYSPQSVKLSISSRPPSMMGADSLNPPSDAIIDFESYLPSSLRMGGRGRRDSQTWSDAVFDNDHGLGPGDRIRYEVNIPAWEEGEVPDGSNGEGMSEAAPRMRVLVSLPPTYPMSSPPQLQLLGRYLGNFSIDAGLFGDVTRTYITSYGIPFTPGDVCVFEGLTHVQNLVQKWYTARLSEGAEGEEAREADRKRGKDGRAMSDLDGVSTAGVFEARPSPLRSTFSYSRDGMPPSGDTPDAIFRAEADMFPGLKIVSSEPIVDRRSTFVGHAIRVTDEREVPLVIHELLSVRKIAKAAHPAIFAYRIAKDVGGAAGIVYNTDYDDDGETQAGARIKHLLEILEVENVLVVVSRWYGGTLLGADRFKHINQAARDALELAGFLEEAGGRKKGKK